MATLFGSLITSSIRRSPLSSPIISKHHERNNTDVCVLDECFHTLEFLRSKDEMEQRDDRTKSFEDDSVDSDVDEAEVQHPHQVAEAAVREFVAIKKAKALRKKQRKPMPSKRQFLVQKDHSGVLSQMSVWM